MFTRIVILASLLTVFSGLSAAAQQSGQPSSETDESVIVLDDHSGSMGQLPAPDTAQAFVTELIHLAELSGQPVKIAVIFFGGDGVKVFGDERRMPTSAYKSLHQSLITSWPKPDGGTPLDTAMEECVRIVKALPPQCRVTIVTLTDGKPSSGFLRPQDYPEVKAEQDRQLKALHTKYQGFPPTIVQKVVQKLENAWQTPSTEEFNRLYKIQEKAEFAKTLEHAATLRKTNRVRFISVDFVGGIPELKELHQAAGGKPADLVVANPPSTVIAKLHALGLTALPRIIVQKPVRFEADPNSFERAFPLKLDSVGEAALITLAFETPITNFAKHAVLEAEIEGATHTFDLENKDAGRILSLDAAGNVATATLVLDKLPADGQVTIRFRSVSGTLHVPACTVYRHLRITNGLAPELRPTHLPPDAKAPYRLTPTHAARWTAALRSSATPKPYPIKAIEPVLQNTRDGSQVRLQMHPDSQAPFVFVTDGVRVPQGTYDVDLHITLESGATIVIHLRRHLEVQNVDEYLTIEFPVSSAESTDPTSSARGHLGFGEVGDDKATLKIPVILRSANVDYAISVEPSVDGLADSQGTSPKTQWFTFDRKPIPLPPGRAERIHLKLQVPQNVEQAIVDGEFSGRLVFERTDLGQPMPLRRYKPLSGVADDEPVELVTFTLRRPEIIARAPRGRTDWLKRRNDGSRYLPIPISFWTHFRRSVVLEVSHTSVLPRDVTALASATFTDPQGKQIPSLRLVPAKDTEITQQIPRGGTSKYLFEFEADADQNLPKGAGVVHLSGPGLRSLDIPIEAQPRATMFAPRMKVVLWLLVALWLLLALCSLYWCSRARVYRPGKQFALKSGQDFAGLFVVKPTRRGEVKLVPHKPLKHRLELDDKPKPLLENHALVLVPERVNDGKPVTLEESLPDGSEGRIVAITQILPDEDDRPEVFGEIVSAGPYAKQARTHFRRAIRWLLFAGLAAVLAITIFYPTVVAAAQWLFDLIHPV